MQKECGKVMKCVERISSDDLERVVKEADWKNEEKEKETISKMMGELTRIVEYRLSDFFYSSHFLLLPTSLSSYILTCLCANPDTSTPTLHQRCCSAFTHHHLPERILAVVQNESLPPSIRVCSDFSLFHSCYSLFLLIPFLHPYLFM